MTLWVEVNKNPDGSPDGTATVHSTNADVTKLTTEVRPGSGRHSTASVEITDTLGHVAHALGQGLEAIKQAEANEDHS